MLGALLVLAGSSCSEGPSGDGDVADGSAAGAWHRIDLTDQPPEGAGGAESGASPVRAKKVFWGAIGRKNRYLDGGSIRALEQRVGSRASWLLELGAEPFFSFRPLVDHADPCRCAYRVAVGAGSGAAAELLWLPQEQAGTPAGAEVRVELDDYEGTRVELILEVVEVPVPEFPRRDGAESAGTEDTGVASSGVPTRSALWGSPAVFQRSPETRPSLAAETSDPRVNVLLIGVDTLRADALGAWGRRPSVTPALDRLAAESDVWLRTTSSFNSTNPSFSSLMTGLYGKNHGVYDLNTPLPRDAVTLAERFADAGYATGAFTSVRHLADERSGLGQGFDRMVAPDRQYAAERTVGLAMDWIAAGERPFFLWLHLFDAHTPHTPPQPFALGFAPTADTGLDLPAWFAFRNPGPLAYRHPHLGGHYDLYAAEVSYVDRQIGRLLAFLESRNLVEETLIVFIADHGESMEEHDVYYGHDALWEPSVHVPLMIRWPGSRREGRRFDVLVQNVDVFPTLLEAAGIEAPPNDGEELRGLSDAGGRRAVFAEGASQVVSMVRTDRWKLMVAPDPTRLVHKRSQPLYQPSEKSRYLYDLETDPREEHNLAGNGLEVEERLARLLERWTASSRSGELTVEEIELSEEDREELRALGYL